LIHGKMYWANANVPERIQRANLDGTNVEDLVSTGLDFPTDVALDVHGGKMYWVDSGTNKVQRANLDGSNVQDLVTTGLVTPRYIDLDLGARKMYWTDSDTDKIQRANLDGSGVEDVLTGLPNPQGVAVVTRSGYPVATDVDDRSAPVPQVHLDVPQPNPFNPSTAIAFTHPGGPLELAIYDVRGRWIRTLWAGEHAAGRHSIQWDGRTSAGDQSPAGVYFVRLSSSGQERSAKLVVVR
jgi:hypothetical protein